MIDSDTARKYFNAKLYAHIVGYDSSVCGRSGIERSYNDALTRGFNVVSTVNSKLQQLAQEALGDRSGAVIALRPQTGEVRALWSNPSFDPTPYASHDAQEATAACDELQSDPRGSGLLNLATSRGYPPGSTFKVVTTAAALQSGRYDATVPSTIPCSSSCRSPPKP